MKIKLFNLCVLTLGLAASAYVSETKMNFNANTIPLAIESTGNFSEMN